MRVVQYRVGRSAPSLRLAVLAMGGFLLASGASLPTPACADDDMPATGGPPKTWDITLGVGAALRPTFAGSDRSIVSPMPELNITWDDMVSLGPNGLNAYWHNDKFRLGAGLTYDGGRQDSASNGIFGTGDDRLHGLGDIDPSVGFRIFGSYRLATVDLNLSATQFAGAQNNGTLVDFSISRRLKLGERLTLTPRIGTTWASENYMQTYFGVTAVQAENSMFHQYNASAGLRDVAAGLNLKYQLDRNWFIATDAGLTEYIGSAANSPITMSNTNETVIVSMGYHF